MLMKKISYLCFSIQSKFMNAFLHNFSILFYSADKQFLCIIKITLVHFFSEYQSNKHFSLGRGTKKWACKQWRRCHGYIFLDAVTMATQMVAMVVISLSNGCHPWLHYHYQMFPMVTLSLPNGNLPNGNFDAYIIIIKWLLWLHYHYQMVTMVTLSLPNVFHGYNIIIKWLPWLHYHYQMVALVTISLSDGCHGYIIIIKWLPWLQYHIKWLPWLHYYYQMVSMFTLSLSNGYHGYIILDAVAFQHKC